MFRGYTRTLIPIGLASRVCSIRPYIIAKIKVETTEVMFIGLNGNLLNVGSGMMYWLVLFYCNIPFMRAISALYNPVNPAVLVRQDVEAAVRACFNICYPAK